MDEQAVAPGTILMDADTERVRRLLDFMDANDLTQDQIAEKIGRKQPTISRWQREIAEVDDPNHERTAVTPLKKGTRQRVRRFLRSIGTDNP